MHSRAARPSGALSFLACLMLIASSSLASTVHFSTGKAHQIHSQKPISRVLNSDFCCWYRSVSPDKRALLLYHKHCSSAGDHKSLPFVALSQPALRYVCAWKQNISIQRFHVTCSPVLIFYSWNSEMHTDANISQWHIAHPILYEFCKANACIHQAFADRKKMSSFFHEICNTLHAVIYSAIICSSQALYSGGLRPSSGKSSMVLASAKTSSHKHLPQNTLSSASKTYRTIDAGAFPGYFSWNFRYSWSKTA